MAQRVVLAHMAQACWGVTAGNVTLLKPLVVLTRALRYSLLSIHASTLLSFHRLIVCLLSYCHSVADNNLVRETDYVKKDKVQGDSFEVGAKVTYEGREMTVIKAPDSDGDIKMVDMSGVIALAAALKDSQITSLK